MGILGGLLDLGLSRFERARGPIRAGFARGGLSSRLVDAAAARRAIQELQLQRLLRAARYAATRSPFYHDLFARAGVRPEALRTLEDFAHLPFTFAADVQAGERLLAVPEAEVRAVYTSSGSTGAPKRVYYTAGDLLALTNVGALGMRLQLPGRLVALIALPTGLWAGMGEAQRVVERAGGLGLPIGQVDPPQALRLMRLFRPNVLISAPTYGVALTREAARQEYRPKLDALFLGGETLTREQGDFLRQYWGAETFDTYGMTEIGGGQAMSLPGCANLHLNGLQFYTEIVDPASGAPAAEGELVFTALARRAMPLIRYRSADLARWGDCRCWPFPSIRLLGRADDLLVVGDMGLYASVLAEAIARAKGASGRLEIRLQPVDLIDAMTLTVEGEGIDAGEVLALISGAYPEVRQHLANGSFRLEIRSSPALEGQLKAFRIVRG